MIIDCTACGITHRTKQEASAMHDATASIHKWLRDRMLLCTSEPEPPVMKARANKPEKWDGRPL